MFATNPRRLKELRYIRMRSIGASARSAAVHAGYHPHGSHHIERRLKPEVAARKAQLRGMNGSATWTISRRDVHRVLWSELARLADHFGPHAKSLEQQALRALAQQVKLGDAREHHGRIQSKLHREQKAGGVTARTLKQRELCLALIVEIAKLKGAPAAGEQFSREGKASVESGSEYLTGTRAHEGRPAADRCPAHPSQPRACRLCQFAAPPAPGYER